MVHLRLLGKDHVVKRQWCSYVVANKQQGQLYLKVEVKERLLRLILAKQFEMKCAIFKSLKREGKKGYL